MQWPLHHRHTQQTSQSVLCARRVHAALGNDRESQTLLAWMRERVLYVGMLQHEYILVT